MGQRCARGSNQTHDPDEMMKKKQKKSQKIINDMELLPGSLRASRVSDIDSTMNTAYLRTTNQGKSNLDQSEYEKQTASSVQPNFGSQIDEKNRMLIESKHTDISSVVQQSPDVKSRSQLNNTTASDNPSIANPPDRNSRNYMDVLPSALDRSHNYEQLEDAIADQTLRNSCVLDAEVANG